jgi:hypothetical protein
VIDPQWVIVAIAAGGIVGQLAIGQRNQGARDEKLTAHEARLNKHSSKIDAIEGNFAIHGERIARVEARIGHAAGLPGGD